MSLANVSAEDLSLEVIEYETTATSERFLQWVTPQGKIAGFLRLSLPHANAMAQLEEEYREATSKTADCACGLSFPLQAGEAMIREVHVYGRVENCSTLASTMPNIAVWAPSW